MKIKRALVLLIISASFLSAQNNNRKDVSITVYNSNLGVVKDVREMKIEKGTNELKLSDVAQQIDPTSVHIKIDGSVLEQNFQYDLVSSDKILQKYIDKDINLIAEDGSMVSGKLLSVYSGEYVIQKTDGGLTIIPDISDYKISVESLPDGLITKPTLVWLVNANSSNNQDVEVTYQTKGISWSAEYVALLNKDDSKLDLNAWVSIKNQSGAAYKDAKLKLVAGDLNLVQTRNYPNMMKAHYDAGMVAEAAPQFEEKSFFEYHIYNLQRRTTVANNETKQISLFESEGVSADKKYIYNSGRSDKVGVFVEFKNSSENKLGMPMPKGKVRVYKSDGDSPQFIGEDLIDHTPKNEKLTLKIGDAFDVLGEEKVVSNTRITSKISEQEFEVKLTNRKDDDINVEVKRYLSTNWEILSSNFDYKKVDAYNVDWNIPVKADNETFLKFKVRYEYK